MSVVVLHPNYVKKLAESYKLLRESAPADQERLETIHKAATRCIAAHMRAELQLTPDVTLPLGSVLYMLQYVQRVSEERLQPVPEPQDFDKPIDPALRPFLVRAVERLHRLVAA